MQPRHLDRQRYFNELSNTSKKFYISYISNYLAIRKGCRVLEIGCGEGGNLLPFAEMGCQVTGIDRSAERIAQAGVFFQSFNCEGNFIAIDFFEMEAGSKNDKYDIILIHDVIEHISQKDKFLTHVGQFVNKEGIVFWGFPAWQMPFGGHQQICHSRICSRLPFIHLLPKSLYSFVLSSFGEPKNCIDELIDIKKCGVSIEKFEKLAKRNNHVVIGRQFWFINPHYEQKFNLTPRILNPFISRIRYIRNFFTTSCFYVTKYGTEL